MTLEQERPIRPGYGILAVFGRAALETNWDSEVAIYALLELGDDLDIDEHEQQRIIANARDGRKDPWHH